MSREKTLVLNSKQIGQRINRLAWQLFEQCYEEKEIIIAGIASSGFVIAKKIETVLLSISPMKITLIELCIDKENPLSKPTIKGGSISDLSGKTIVVIDDVSNSGRTLMYGVKFFLEFPVKSVLTLVLVDRDHNRFPVKTNFVGLSLATTMQEHISVELAEGKDAVYLD
ncbi:MAG: phosphoribosyltransferase [Bacteroidetes bacterium]|nr:phosphoribosyltransferase [Bacteroidota bacterium]